MPTPRIAPTRDSRRPWSQCQWSRRPAIAIVAALLSWGLAGCHQAGPGERVLEPAGSASTRPVATFGPDDAVVDTDPAAAGPVEPRRPPTRSDCAPEQPTGRRCAPSPRP